MWPVLFAHAVHKSGLLSMYFEVSFIISQVELREAREVIADKDSVVEEKERMILLVNREKEELIRQNRVHLPSFAPSRLCF